MPYQLSDTIVSDVHERTSRGLGLSILVGPFGFQRGLIILAMGLLTGCGTGPAPAPSGEVVGSVTLKGDPLFEGRINYVSEKTGVGASAELQPDGSYTLEAPLPTGDYNVFFTFDIAPTQFGTDAEFVMKLVPPKYLAQNTSKLKVEVDLGANEHEFDLQ